MRLDLVFLKCSNAPCHNDKRHKNFGEKPISMVASEMAPSEPAARPLR